jgi:glutamate-5-semialdehyde dehydrogenase
MNVSLEQIGTQAKAAELVLRTLATNHKNKALYAAGDQLITDQATILAANKKDIENAQKNQMTPALQDRLLLTKDRILQMANGLKEIAELEDPVGEVVSMKQRPNGLMIGNKRVPLGVIGIIYEARPNVTADAFGLCFKAGNVVILKGGSDALFSNAAITESLRKALEQQKIPADAIQLIADSSRETTQKFMKLNQYIDVLIPRGGAGLIQAVVTNATVPVIETGTGNCHIYVDKDADISMACDIIFNSKTNRIGVCNACESLVIHEQIAAAAIPAIVARLKENNVEIRGDEESMNYSDDIIAAKQDDWGKEYLDNIISVKTVATMDAAISHINQYNTGHSEAIITENYTNAQRFLNEIDAACVYVNASTRYTDGYEFGFGAEIGISTQKLHARGPMGLLALTSTKYIIYGNGQVRP